MTSAHGLDAAPEHSSPLKPPGAREFTPRAIVVAIVVAAVIGAAYPYIVLKLGFGPNIAVVSAFFGYLALSVGPRKGGLRWESNLAQAAGTTAGQTAFMCSIIAAFDILTADPEVGVDLSLSTTQTFLWMTSAGVLGVILAVPLRKHFIEDEKLPFPDGFAAGEALIVLDSRGPEARIAIRSLLGGLFAAALLAWATMRQWFAEEMALSLNRFSHATGVGISWSLLNIGSGIIIGLRICANMLLGSTLSWVIAPVLLANAGIITEAAKKRDVLVWIMWPATGMMVAGGLVALVLKWRILTKTFTQLSKAGVDSREFPMKLVVIGAIMSTIALILVQYFSLNLPVWQTCLAIVFTLPLMLVGLRVLGETNWGPISALSNLMQGVFGLIVPGNIQANMVASGVTGSIVAESEGLIQSYKTGDMIGSTPKYLTYIQLLAVPIGALSMSLVYPLLIQTYGLTGDNALPAPIAQKWVGFAKLLSQGTSALHPSALWALMIGATLGVVFTLLEQKREWKTWVPSPTGIGIGMLVPFSAVATMFIGALIDWAVRKKDAKQGETWLVPLASGFIAGEAFIAVIVPLLIFLGVLTVLK